MIKIKANSMAVRDPLTGEYKPFSAINGNALPKGGTDNQVLLKDGSDDYKSKWGTVTVPTKVSELENDENYINKVKTVNGNDITGEGDIEIKGFSGDYNDLINKPTIPTLNLIYPVGSIYMSVNSTDPGTLFGGTWERLKDRFLLGAGDTYVGGATGGSASNDHTHSVTSNVTIGATSLTANQLGSHSHSLVAYAGGNAHYIIQRGQWTPNYTWFNTDNAGGNQSHTHTPTNNSVTSGSPSDTNNMPPYLSVYIWKRTQ